MASAGSSARAAFLFYALTTLPLRRQDVQTRMRLVVAPTFACTGRRLTFQRRLLTLWAWLMVLPLIGFLPQISQTCAIGTASPESSELDVQTLDCTGFGRVWPTSAQE